MRRKLLFFLMFIWTMCLVAQNSKSKYIMHKVVFGESLSKIAQKYKVDMDDILRINPSLTKDNLNPDQIIRIPNKQQKTENKNNTKPIEKSEKTTVEKNKKTHIVQDKETLYGISKIYGVSIEDLVKWNKLKSSNLISGSEIYIAEPKQTEKPATTVSKSNVPEKTDTKPIEKEKPNTVVKKSEKIKDEKVAPKVNPIPIQLEKPKTNEVLATDTPETTFSNKPDIQASSNETQKELKSLFAGQNGNPTEKIRGTGAPMTTSLGQMETAYVAQHRTLPVGTVIKIKNLVNSKVVFAKIIGKLFDNQDNKNIIIRYSLGIKKDLQLLNGKNYIEIELPQ